MASGRRMDTTRRALPLRLSVCMNGAAQQRQEQTSSERFELQTTGICKRHTRTFGNARWICSRRSARVRTIVSKYEMGTSRTYLTYRSSLPGYIVENDDTGGGRVSYDRRHFFSCSLPYFSAVIFFESPVSDPYIRSLSRQVCRSTKVAGG
jgi:hypothetical protein